MRRVFAAFAWHVWDALAVSCNLDAQMMMSFRQGGRLCCGAVGCNRTTSKLAVALRSVMIYLPCGKMRQWHASTSMASTTPYAVLTAVVASTTARVLVVNGRCVILKSGLCGRRSMAAAMGPAAACLRVLFCLLALLVLSCLVFLFCLFVCLFACAAWW